MKKIKCLSKISMAIVCLCLFGSFQPITKAYAYNDTDLKSSTLTGNAWEALNANDFTAVLKYTNQCIYLYGPKAKEMQALLTTYPVGNKDFIFTYWALNDVAACYFIQGEAFRKNKMTDQMIEAYLILINDYTYGQVYDPKGNFFWKPTDNALVWLGLNGYEKKYSAALYSISAYKNLTIDSKLSLYLSKAQTMVNVLKGYNGILVDATGLGLYDNAFDLLGKANKSQLLKKNDIYTLTKGATIDTPSYGQNIKVDDKGSIFVYAPASTASGVGTIYQYKQHKLAASITPVDAQNLKFAVSGNILVTINKAPYSVSNRAVANVFVNQNGAWVKVSSLDITSATQQSFPDLSLAKASDVINVALSKKALVVTLADGRFLVFNNYYATLPKNPFSFASFGKLDGGVYSVDADGDYIVMGSVDTGKISILEATNNTQWKWNRYNKQLIKAGQHADIAVAVNESSVVANSVTVAYSKVSHSNQKDSGVVNWINKPKTLKTWPEFKSLPLFVPSSAIRVGSSAIVIKDDTLVIPYVYSKSKNTSGYPLYTSSVMVYKLVTANQLAWYYSLDGGDSVVSRLISPVNVATGNSTTAFASSFPSEPGKDVVSVISPK